MPLNAYTNKTCDPCSSCGCKGYLLPSAPHMQVFYKGKWHCAYLWGRCKQTCTAYARIVSYVDPGPGVTGSRPGATIKVKMGDPTQVRVV